MKISEYMYKYFSVKYKYFGYNTSTQSYYGNMKISVEHLD